MDDKLLYELRELLRTHTHPPDRGHVHDYAPGVHDHPRYKNHHGVQTYSTLDFDDATKVLSLASITYWYKGTKVVVTSPTCDLDLTADRDNSSNTVAANTLYYFYFKDTTGKIYWSDSSWSFKENVFVATVFWNGSAGACQNECHIHTRDLDWHIWAHDTIGTRYETGSTLTYPDAANDDTLQIETGTYHDEDIDFTTGQCTTMRGWYKVSASVYTFADYAFPYLGTTGQPQYLDTDTYALTNVAASDFVNYWVYVSNDIDRKIYVIPTHAAAAFNTLLLARAATSPVVIGLNINTEFKLIYRFIYKGDGEFQESTDYRSSSPVPGGGTATVTAGSVSFVPTGDLSSTNVQSALAELDTEKASTTHASTHQSGGSDTIKLDDLAAPDDNTDLNATTSAHGLLKKLSNTATEFMNGQGNWATPAGGSDIGCRVYNSANISLAYNSWQTLTFDSERWDTDTMHSTVTNTERITCVTAGKYLIGAQVEFTAAAGGGRRVRIVLYDDSEAATEYWAQQLFTASSSDNSHVVLVTDINMAAGDYVYVQCYQNQTSTGALNILADTKFSPEFWAQKIG